MFHPPLAVESVPGVAAGPEALMFVTHLIFQSVGLNSDPNLMPVSSYVPLSLATSGFL